VDAWDLEELASNPVMIIAAKKKENKCFKDEDFKSASNQGLMTVKGFLIEDC